MINNLKGPEMCQHPFSRYDQWEFIRAIDKGTCLEFYYQCPQCHHEEVKTEPKDKEDAPNDAPNPEEQTQDNKQEQTQEDAEAQTVREKISYPRAKSENQTMERPHLMDHHEESTLETPEIANESSNQEHSSENASTPAAAHEVPSAKAGLLSAASVIAEAEVIINAPEAARLSDASVISEAEAIMNSPSLGTQYGEEESTATSYEGQSSITLNGDSQPTTSSIQSLSSETSINSNSSNGSGLMSPAPSMASCSNSSGGDGGDRT